MGMCVCMYVCMYVIRNKKKVLGRFEKFFFSCKGMDRQSNMGYIRSFAHNAELQETPKTVKKSSKNGFFGLPRLYCKKFLHNFDENWLNGVKDIFAPKYEKKLNSQTNAELQEPRKTVQKTRFSDFRKCIVESYCMNCLSGTVIIVGRGGPDQEDTTSIVKINIYERESPPLPHHRL